MADTRKLGQIHLPSRIHEMDPVGADITDFNHPLSIYAIEKVTVASTHYQFVVGRRLPGEPDAWSEIVPRCSRACWAVTRIPQNAVRQCSSVVCRNNEAGIRARCRTSSRDRHRLNLAQPEVGQIAVLVGGITMELPPQTEVE